MTLRVLVVGLGSIGRRHLANVRRLQPDADVTVLRHRRTDDALVEGADRYVYTLDDALRLEPDAALICGPASTHLATALPLAREGVHLFVEKPLADATAGVEELIATCERLRTTLATGYNLRFLSSLNSTRDALRSGAIGRLMTIRAEVGQYLPDWRPSVDYRGTVSASAALGGGAALELSHEIDYVRWLCGEVDEVFAYAQRLSDLDIDVEDTVEMILRFESGVLGSIHLDMTQRLPVRTCRLVGTEGTLVWDGSAAGDVAASYVGELEDFFVCVRNGATPRVDGREGLRTLEVALAAKSSAREARPVSVRCAPARSA